LAPIAQHSFIVDEQSVIAVEQPFIEAACCLCTCLAPDVFDGGRALASGITKATPRILAAIARIEDFVFMSLV
jgi:hypothetical protein